MTTILPTRTCFDDALDYLELIAKEGDPEIHELVLVHAICLNPQHDHPFAHAWLENPKKGTMIFAGMIDGVKYYVERDLAEHYAGLRVLESTRYTPLEASRENNRTGHYGPWEERYLALCRERRVKAKVKAKFCRLCGQPLKPKGVQKRPNEYDHARGCPYSRNVRTPEPKVSQAK